MNKQTLLRTKDNKNEGTEGTIHHDIPRRLLLILLVFFFEFSFMPYSLYQYTHVEQRYTILRVSRRVSYSGKYISVGAHDRKICYRYKKEKLLHETQLYYGMCNGYL